MWGAQATGYQPPPGYLPPPGYAPPPGQLPPPGYQALSGHLPPPGYHAPPGYQAPPVGHFGPPGFQPQPGQPGPWPAGWQLGPAGWQPVPAQLPQVATEPPPPEHKWGFGAFLLAEAVFLITSFLIVVPFVMADPRLSEPGVPLTPVALLVSLAIPTMLAALVAIVTTRIRGNGPIIDLRLRFGWRDVGIGVACGFGGLALTLVLAPIWVRWVGDENADSAVGALLDGVRMNPLLAVLVFLTIWLVAPLCEEILYRGLLWGAMERRRWNRWLILGITTVVFAFAHFELLRAPLLLAIGLPMGLARMLSGRLPASIIAHQINNFLPALGLMLLLLGVPLTEA